MPLFSHLAIPGEGGARGRGPSPPAGVARGSGPRMMGTPQVPSGPGFGLAHPVSWRGPLGLRTNRWPVRIQRTFIAGEPKPTRRCPPRRALSVRTPPPQTASPQGTVPPLHPPPSPAANYLPTSPALLHDFLTSCPRRPLPPRLTLAVFIALFGGVSLTFGNDTTFTLIAPDGNSHDEISPTIPATCRQGAPPGTFPITCSAPRPATRAPLAPLTTLFSIRTGAA